MDSLVGQGVLAYQPSSAKQQDDLCAAMRSFGVMLTLVPTNNGVVLEGVSPTFYGKQMAQELARKAQFVVVANRIHVDRAVAGV